MAVMIIAASTATELIPIQSCVFAWFFLFWALTSFTFSIKSASFWVSRYIQTSNHKQATSINIAPVKAWTNLFTLVPCFKIMVILLSSASVDAFDKVEIRSSLTFDKPFWTRTSLIAWESFPTNWGANLSIFVSWETVSPHSTKSFFGNLVSSFCHSFKSLITSSSTLVIQFFNFSICLSMVLICFALKRLLFATFCFSKASIALLRISFACLASNFSAIWDNSLALSLVAKILVAETQAILVVTPTETELILEESVFSVWSDTSSSIWGIFWESPFW